MPRRKIKVVNKTHWQTRHLLAFIHRIANEILSDGRSLKVHVRYNRQVHGGCSGYAWYNTGSMVLRLPSQSVDRVDLAHLIAHELGHCRGLNHRDMRGSAIYQRVGRWREIYAWADSLPLEKKAVKKKARLIGASKAEVGLANAIKKLAEMERRIRRTQTLAKKYRTRVRYYTRRLESLRAADGPGVNVQAQAVVVPTES